MGKYNLRKMNEQEACALFWDEARSDYVFPSAEAMNRFASESKNKEPAACLGKKPAAGIDFNGPTKNRTWDPTMSM